MSTNIVYQSIKDVVTHIVNKAILKKHLFPGEVGSIFEGKIVLIRIRKISI